MTEWQMKTAYERKSGESWDAATPFAKELWESAWVAARSLARQPVADAAAPSGEQEPDMPPPLKDHQRSHAVSLYMSLPHSISSAEAIITKVAADAYVNGFQTGKHCAASTGDTKP